MKIRREIRKARIQLAKEEGNLRELRMVNHSVVPGNASLAPPMDIENSEHEVKKLRERLKRLKGRI